MTTTTATYSPEDNKLRLYSTSRLDKETYTRVKAAGFRWAPKQELFVAPMWTPEREDLLIELCGEIDDEDTSLVERQEQRAERFEDYSESRANDAQIAYNSSSQIAERFAGGQPILVGHHSEKRARKDKERIDNSMRKAVKMWDTSKYWESRAAGALRHAKYKELPGVRARRIKGLEADQRKQQRYLDDYQKWLDAWAKCEAETDKDKQHKMGVAIANVCHLRMPRKEGDRKDFDQAPDVYTVLTNSYPNLYAPRTIEEVFAAAKACYPRTIERQERWVNHYQNRIAYERAMLDESGGLVTDRAEMQPGGRVLRRGEWFPILKVNKRGGVFQSVTVSGHFATTITADEIKDYMPPKEGDTEKVKAAMKLPPMCNYPGDGFKHMTTTEWKRKKMSDVPQSERHAATDKNGEHRTRSTWGGNWTTVSVYLTDSKQIDPPAPSQVKAEPLKFEKMKEAPQRVEPQQAKETQGAPIPVDALRETLKAGGVQVVAAPQLFPTPRDLAERMVDLAEIQPGDRVLEPSAGTGAILGAMGGRMFGHNPDRGELMAVEINDKLAQHLEREFPLTNVATADFLECGTHNLGTFDVILMNPPFGAASDIRHIKHALGFLRPGGRLVAICAHGPRQVAALKPLADVYGGTWESLPDGTFKDAGTNVHSALLSFSLPLDEAEEYPEIEEAPEEAPELEEQAPAFQLMPPEPTIQRTPAGLQYMLFSLAAN